MNKILFLPATADVYGSNLVLLQIIRLLSSSNQFEIHIVLPDKGKLIPLIKPFKNVRIVIKSYAILRRRNFSPIGIVSYIVTFLKSITFLFIYIKKNKISSVYTNSSVVIPGALVSYILGIKHIWHLHEVLNECTFINIVFKLVINIFSDKIIAPSKQAIKSFQFADKFSNKYELVYNGVDIKKFGRRASPKEVLLKKYNLNQDVKYIGMAGRLSPRKGHTIFIQAASKMCQNHNDVEFLIAGEAFYKKDNYLNSVNKEIYDLELDKKITFLGHISNMQEFYPMLDIFVLPSILPECFPLTILEAMAMGIPVVSSALGGPLEIIENGKDGYLYPHDSTDELVTILSKLVIDDHKRKLLSTNAQKKIKERFTEEIFNKNMQEFFKQNF